MASNKKFKDFDAMFSELQREKLPFRIFGKTYEINKEIPASLVLELARHEEDEDLGTQFLLKAGRHIFGDAILDELCEKPEFNAQMLGTMIRWAFNEINGNGEGEDDGEEITEDDTGVQQAKN